MTSSYSSPLDEEADERVIHPQYDVGGIATIDYIRAKLTPKEFRGACRFNVLKYVSRAGHKGSALEDYRKAMDYLQWLIESLELKET